MVIKGVIFLSLVELVEGYFLKVGVFDVVESGRRK